MLKDERINGVTAQEALKYGIVSTEVDPRSNKRIFIRMSKFLLRFFLKKERVLEEILGCPVSLVDPTMTLAHAMPEGVDLHDIFLACRSHNSGKTQEVVQLMSLLVTCIALMLVESPPPLTLISIRPMPTLMGRVELATMELEWLAKAAEAVTRAGIGAYNMAPGTHGDKLEAKTQARHAEAIKQAVKMVAPADALGAASTAALFASINFPGFDIWARLGLGVYLGQSKGAKDAMQRREVNYAGEAKPWLSKMINMAKGKRVSGKCLGRQVGVAPVKSRGNPAVDLLPSVDRLLFLELLVARPISKGCLDKMQGQIADLNPVLDTCVIVLDQNQLRTALGPIFGGIAARCEE